MRDNVTFGLDSATLRIRGDAVIGDSFTFTNGHISTSSSSSLSIGNGAQLDFAETPAGMFTRGQGFEILGEFSILGNGTMQPYNNQSGGWLGLTLKGSGANGSSLSNTQISGSTQGVRLIGVQDINLSSVQITDHQNAGLFVSGSNDITLANTTISGSENDGMVTNQSSVQINPVSRFEDNDRDGLVAEGISFLTFGGASVIKNNRYGVKAVNSWVTMGDPATGGGGSVYNNTDKHVVAQGISQVTAQEHWWGSSPPVSSMFDADVGSFIDYSNWLSSANVLVIEPITSARHTPELLETGGNLLGRFMAEVGTRGSRLAAAQALAGHPNEALVRLAGYIELGEYIRMGLYVEAVETAQAWLEQQPSTKEMKYLYRGLFSAYFFLEEYRAAELAYKKLELLQDPLLVHFRGLLPEDDVIIESADLRDKQAIEKVIAFTNYPNPFNPTSLIEYTLPAEAQVRIDVFNVMGQRVATLVNDRLAAGVHTATFDGSRLASGLYIARMQLNNQVYTRTMMLVK